MKKIYIAVCVMLCLAPQACVKKEYCEKSAQCCNYTCQNTGKYIINDESCSVMYVYDIEHSNNAYDYYDCGSAYQVNYSNTWTNYDRIRDQVRTNGYAIVWWVYDPYTDGYYLQC